MRPSLSLYWEWYTGKTASLYWAGPLFTKPMSRWPEVYIIAGSCLSQYWLRSMSPCDVTMPQWVNHKLTVDTFPISLVKFIKDVFECQIILDTFGKFLLCSFVVSSFLNTSKIWVLLRVFERNNRYLIAQVNFQILANFLFSGSYAKMLHMSITYPYTVL